MCMDPVTRQVYEHCASDLLRITSRRERGEVVRRAAEVLGVSEKTVWRNVRGMGWASGRKTRADKGSSVLTNEDLREVARIVASNINKHGEPNTPTSEAWRIAKEQGMAAGKVSRGHLGRRLREEGYDITRMRSADPSISIVTLFPNQAWFADASVAIQWYFRDEHGKLLSQYDDPEARFYAGKFENYKALRRVIYRYIVVDHYSGAFYVYYTYNSGERPEDVADLLYRAMSDKGMGDTYPFRGVPKYLYTDKGPAFNNQLILTLCGPLGLGIAVKQHKPKNAKASGAVEKLHDIWQRTFEGRLRIAGSAKDLEELNRLALKWCAKINADRVHGRHGKPRMVAWSAISSEQLVECPERKVFFRLINSASQDATLDSHHWIRHNNRKWLLRGENLYTGQKVKFREAPFSDVGIRVWDDQDRELAVEEIRFDSVSGFPQNGRRQVLDDPEHEGATTPAPAAKQVLRAIKEGTETVHIPGALDTGPIPSFLAPKAGTTWRPPQDGALYAEPLIGSLDAREEIALRLGRPLGEDGTWWRERLGPGVTQSRLDELWAEFTSPAEVSKTG